MSRSREHAPQYFVDPPKGDELLISGDDARHLTLVRRAAPGDMIRAGDGAGHVYQGRIDSISDIGVLVKIVEESTFQRPSPRITVIHGLAKGEKVDSAVPKLVELGVDEIVIFMAGRSVPRWDERKASAALQRWRKIALEAAKQSHRAYLPEVRGPLNLTEAVVACKGHALVAVVGASASLSQGLATGSEDLVLVVGPEGGLGPDEVAAFEAGGATPVSLGSQILRTETAVVAIASAALFATGRLG